MTRKPAWIRSISHCSNHEYLSNPYPKLGDVIMVSLQVDADAPIEQIILRTMPDGEQQFTTMARGGVSRGLQTWQAELVVNQPLVSYRFGIQTTGHAWWMNAVGASIQEPLSLFDFKIIADLNPISWLREAIFYQIFPDRFENGDPTNDPDREEVGYRGMVRETLPWGQPREGGDYEVAFYGGDLQGINQRLEHLLNLGVNAIYLNPVFTSLSNHRYDGINYEQVDPVLGGDEALVALRQHLNEHGMHYTLDIAPNHCGYMHPWFQQAREDKDSLEAGFFYFDQHPDQYVSWMGHKYVPKLNYASKELRRRMYEGEESVIKRWLKPPFSADGWRVDVANMLGRHNEQQLDGEVIGGIRQAVKSVNPQAYLIGENFYEASEQLDGNGWDAVMNYAGFSGPLWNWLSGVHLDALNWEGEFTSHRPWPTEALVRTWQDHMASVPWQITCQQFNLLDSHDTRRIRSTVNGNDALQRMAAIIQFTFPGVPCVYYGDEIGMMDEPGFGSRNCMQWDENRWNKPLWDFYRKLIDFRKNSEILKDGSFRILYWEKDLVLYERELDGKRILVSANRSPVTRSAKPLKLINGRIMEGTRFKSLFEGHDAFASSDQLTLPALPQGAVIWIETEHET